MQEIIAGILMSFDVVALYLVANNVKYKWLLASWTACLHMVFPLIGFYCGQWLADLLVQWSNSISLLLLFFIGLQLLLSRENENFPAKTLPIIAIFASFDTFSVSLSFGMLNLDKYTFILSAGISTLILSYMALIIAQKNTILKNGLLKKLAGLLLIIMSVLLLI
ncbi:manganese efflux pump MntP family protein [Solibacillus sp. MA9]|uniref:Manganese efflux pump MntP family protein n=1 Tax=Solibacillus palustris TaxID=2908203 RepID=A0ABS9U8A1_9BACL|nr:manganese efflux pump [Solibacillus sp. MA9]MCH7320557.1 manganese efflux pump MntP family protein [Solibacillus sp. MA9]